jgi:gliding motility-associated-like protein
LKIHQLPIFNLGNDSLLFCLGVGTQLDGPSGYISYLWSTGDNLEDIEVLETGTYSLLVTDDQGCLYTDTIFVIGEWPLFQLPNDTIEFCFGDPLLVNAPSGFDFYQWNTGSTQNFIKITETGEYVLVITDLNGCSYSDTLYALGGDCEVQNQPNVFTPNGDGFNDKFTINPYGMNSYKMIIHDRWGKFIKNVSSNESGWDGSNQFGQEMIEGVYYFVATVEFMNKSSEEIKGMIQLLK